MNNGFVYLAVPYTSPDPAVMQYRYDMVNLAAGKLLQEGHAVYSPISQTHVIASVCDLPKEWAFWRRMDEEFLACCRELAVLQLPGWTESIGVQDEMAYATEYQIPITFLDPEIYCKEPKKVGQP